MLTGPHLRYAVMCFIMLCPSRTELMAYFIHKIFQKLQIYNKIKLRTTNF